MGDLEVKKVLVVNELVLTELSKQFNITKKEFSNKFEYKSPNGYFVREISLVEIEEYRTCSFSLPTTELEKYESIAEDIMDYKSFMDSFELEDFEVAMSRIINEINTKK